MSRVFDAANIAPNEQIITTASSAVYNNLQALTLAAWVYSTNNAINGTIAAKDPTGVYTPALLITSGTVFGQVVCNTSGAVSTSIETVTLNTWTHVAMTYDNAGDKKVHCYINGVETTYSVQSVGVGGPKDDSAHGYWIGNNSFDDGFSGKIAELVEYNVALTSSQVAALAASTTGATVVLPGNIVGYWHLLGVNSPEPDASGNNNVGTLSANAPVVGINSPGYNVQSTVHFSPATVDFGYVAVSSNKQVVVSVYNDGPGTITLTDVNVSGTDFSFPASTITGDPYPPGLIGTGTVEFAPLAVESPSGLFYVVSTDILGNIGVPLSGTTSNVYSQPDCRNFGKFPNGSVYVGNTATFTVVPADSRLAGPPVDSRAAGAPVDSRVTKTLNSRTPGTYGPGE